MTEDEVIARNMQELMALCSGIIEQGKLISKHHADEQRAIAAILPSMCERVGNAFPLSIVHRDKPDFLLRFAGHSVGLEVTRFLAPALAHATVTASRLCTQFFPTRFDFDSPKRSKREMERAVLALPAGLADWKSIFNPRYVDQIIASVEDKKQKILLDGNMMADEHWLLIDDHQRMSDLQFNFVVQQSQQRLIGHWTSTPHFTKVLILSGSVLVDLNEHNPGWGQFSM